MHRLTLPLIILLICLSKRYANAISNNNNWDIIKNSTTSNTNSPIQITTGYIGERWKNITISDKLVSFYDDLGDDLDLLCKAEVPVRWRVIGVISPQEIVKFLPPKRNLLAGTFEIKVSFFFGDAVSYHGLISSAHVICEEVTGSSLDQVVNSDKVSIFVTGTKQPILQSKSLTIQDSKIIPCFTSVPTDPLPKLYFINSTAEQLVENVIYDPVEGFRHHHHRNVSGGDDKEVPPPFQGEYVCRKGSNDTVKIVALISNPTVEEDYKFSPLHTNPLQALSEETITFKCSSKSKPVELRFINDNNVSVSFVTDMEMVKEAIVGVVVVGSLLDQQPDSKEVVRGRVECLGGGGDRKVVIIKEWSYEFYATPTLYLDNFEGEVDCLTAYTPRRIQTVRCKNNIDCNFMNDQCFENSTSCNFKRQKQFVGETDTRCWVEGLGGGRDCASVPYSHLNGVAQCTVGDNILAKRWEYFVSLDFLKYTNWNDAPLRELVRMDEMNSTLYTNGSTRFYCTAVAYLFADSLTFQLEYSNGSRVILEDNGQTTNITIPSSEERRKIDEFNIIGVLDILLPLDAVGVHCKAPWWNSSGVLEVGRGFVTRHLLLPTIIDSTSSSTQITFYTEEEDRRLSCVARGEPQPSYMWLFKKKSDDDDGLLKPALDTFPELRTSLGSNGEGYLEFPIAKSRHSGEYRCVAENSVGRVERVYRLGVEDEPVSGRAVVYIITVFVILAILVLVLGVLVVFVLRYNAAKKLVRALTDNEIDEFFQGKPELLSNQLDQGTSVEVIDFLPYKKEFEISVDDIEFDHSSSDKNFLGSGEFSYVVRGRIISRSLPVAVKISKPTADVSLFKSLLSEVKIMIYIGEHWNVVKLVGVCTESIRNRSIHIATEICGLGSLDIYLRKGRPFFCNLIDANQKIDLSLKPDPGSTLTPDQLTTLDLINFSAQVAKGMEYLSYKSVIHADLAARNVLLTSEKIAKISDFGLSKKLYECNNYVKKSKSPLPWRWMPPESLTTLTFSTQSDVWSYGALLYEIFTLGDIPFPNEEWNKEFLSRLANGMRMGRPKFSTQEIYSKIVVCWEAEPIDRPSFSVLRAYFDEVLGEYDGVGDQQLQQQQSEESNNEEVIAESLYANYDEVNNSGKVTSGGYDDDEFNDGTTPHYINNDETLEGVFQRSDGGGVVMKEQEEEVTKRSPNYMNL